MWGPLSAGPTRLYCLRLYCLRLYCLRLSYLAPGAGSRTKTGITRSVFFWYSA